jgi:hypothetical protein
MVMYMVKAIPRDDSINVAHVIEMPRNICVPKGIKTRCANCGTCMVSEGHEITRLCYVRDSGGSKTGTLGWSGYCPRCKFRVAFDSGLSFKDLKSV